MMEILSGLGTGFAVALDPFNLALVLFGCFFGTLIGALPGIGPINGVAILLPIAYSLGFPPASALIVTRSSCEASTLTAPPSDAASIGRPVCTTNFCPDVSVSASGRDAASRTHGE